MVRTLLLSSATVFALLPLFACGGSQPAAPAASSPAAAASAPAPEGAAPQSAAVDGSSQPVAEDGRVSGEPGPFDPVLDAIGLFAHMARVMVAADSDCERMASDLERWADETQKHRARVNEALREPGVLEKLQARMSKRKDLVEAVQKSVQVCGESASFQAAFQKATSDQ